MLKDKTNLSPVLKVSSKLLLSGVIILSLTAYFFSFEIMNWRYDEHVVEASNTFSILILSALFFAVVLIYGTLLTADGKLRELNYIAIGGVILNFIFNFIMIPKYQAFGSAVATLATQVITAGLHLLLAQRYFKLKINWFIILKMMALTGFLVLFGLNMDRIELAIIIKGVIMAGTGVGLAMVLNLISLKDFIELIKKKSSLSQN